MTRTVNYIKYYFISKHTFKYNVKVSQTSAQNKTKQGKRLSSLLACAR